MQMAQNGDGSFWLSGERFPDDTHQPRPPGAPILSPCSRPGGNERRAKREANSDQLPLSRMGIMFIVK